MAQIIRYTQQHIYHLPLPPHILSWLQPQCQQTEKQMTYFKLHLRFQLENFKMARISWLFQLEVFLKF